MNPDMNDLDYSIGCPPTFGVYEVGPLLQAPHKKHRPGPDVPYSTSTNNVIDSNTNANANANANTSTNTNTNTNSNAVTSEKIRALSVKSDFPPYCGILDTINFCDGYTSIIDREPIRRRHSAPLTWTSLIRADTALSKLWLYLRSKTNMKFREKGKATTKPTNPQTEQNFQERITADEGYDDVKLYKDKVPKPKPKHNLEGRAKSLGLSYYQGGLDTELELIEKIRMVLPKQKAVWLLIRRFFSNIYVQLPFVDEERFKAQVQALIGNENYEDIPLAVRAEKKLDFATLGLLLIVLRLAYLSLFTSVSQIKDDYDPNSGYVSEQVKVMRYLIDNPVNIDVINVAQQCLEQFNLTRGINIAILQLTLFTRIYHMFAPEDGDGMDGGDSMVMNAMLIQMARSLGLHREPDLFPDQCNDARTNNLGRKIWYYLVVIDYNRSLHDGSNCNILPNSFDTKVPYYTLENSNTEQHENEKVAVKCFHSFCQVIDPMHKLISLLATVKGNVSIAELHVVMSVMENNHAKRFGKYLNQVNDNNLSNEEVHFRALGIRIYFTINFVAVSIYFHLFNYYERRRNSDAAYYYLKSIIVRAVCDLMPYYFAFLDKSDTAFKDFTDLTVTPGFEHIIHKSLIVLTSIYIRLKFSITQQVAHPQHGSKMNTDIEYREHFSKLQSFLKVVHKAIHVFKGLIDRLSFRYYYAWRVSKAYSFMDDFMNNSGFFEEYKDIVDYSEFKFTNEMIDELIGLIESSLSKIKHLRKARDDDVSSNGKEQGIFVMSPMNTSVSSESDNFENKPDEEIDRMWVQLMSNKNATDINNWSGDVTNYGDGSTGYGTNMANDSSTDQLDSMYGSFLQNTNFGMDNISFDSANFGLGGPETSDLFYGVPFEEMMKDVQ
jgi:hypothetical protein